MPSFVIWHESWIRTLNDIRRLPEITRADQEGDTDG